MKGATGIPVIAPETTLSTRGVVAVFAPRKEGSVTTRTAIAGAHSPNAAGQLGRQGTTPEELRSELAAIIDYLAVDQASHVRYQPRAGPPSVTSTRMIIVIWLACISRASGGRQTPLDVSRRARPWSRVWTAQLTNNAPTICSGGCAFGPRFGWRQTGTLTKLQTEANAGAVGLIVARRKIDGKSGHIVMVVPETNTDRPRGTVRVR